LATGGLANLFSFGSQILVQLISVPILANAFGLVGYGIWLILSTVPTYLVLSDVGLVTAATNDMTIKYAENDDVGLLTVFQSIAVVVSALFVLLTIIVTALVAVSAILPGVWPDQLRPHVWAIPMLTAYASMCIISMIPVAALRASGFYARGTLIYDSCILIEGLLTLVAAIVTRNLVIAAAAPLIFRTIAMPFIYFHMRALRPEISAGLDHVRMTEIKRLLPAALGVMAIPVGLAISLQGSSLVVGAILGPAAVAVFVPVRTASRMAIQMAGMVGRALIPEIAAARGRGDTLAERRYWRLNALTKWMILVPAAVLFGLFGVQAVALWTGGKIVPPQMFVSVMAIVIVVHGSWFLSAILLTASHDHIGIAKYILIACLAGLGICLVLTQTWGLTGAAASLVCVDLVLAVVVGLAVRQLHRARPAIV
jgi:O-antigen/teichoic acid export membrane protein